MELLSECPASNRIPIGTLLSKPNSCLQSHNQDNV